MMVDAGVVGVSADDDGCAEFRDCERALQDICRSSPSAHAARHA
jgi:hypothetical protein